MRNLILTLLLITVTPFFVNGQKTKGVVIKFPGSEQINEKYEVLKSDKSIKHGIYVSYHKERYNLEGDNLISQTGQYKNGKKDGMWTTYKPPTKKGSITHTGYRISEGEYKDGVKVGVWKTFKEEGKVVLQHDHDSNSDLEPIFYVYASYPAKAQDAGIQGTVKVSYSINTDCTISGLAITYGLEPECDNAALESIRELRRLMKKHSLNKICKAEDRTEEVKFELR
ncbi:MAG: energy transducer TonB [Flavobacteriales bacterium]|nr:energy transducer TonB [Flavobacteriales bacterium]